MAISLGRLDPRRRPGRPIRGNAPSIDLVIDYHKANSSPILRLFLSRLEQLIRRVSAKAGS